MKWLKGVLGLLALALVVVIPLRNSLIKSRLTRALAEQTGFGVELDSVNLGLTEASIELNGLRLYNPPDFPERGALEIRQARVDYDWRSLFSRELRFSEIVLDVPSLVVVRKADGETNAERLGGKGRARARRPAESPAEPTPGPSGGEGPAGAEKPPRSFRVDRLVLRVGTVEYRDHTRAGAGGGPGITAMTLNVEQEHRDVTSLEQLGGLVLGQSVQQLGALLINQELRDLQDENSKLNKKIRKAADKFQNQLNSLFGTPAEK